MKKNKSVSFRMAIFLYSIILILIMIIVNITSLEGLQKFYDNLNNNLKDLPSIGAMSLQVDEMYNRIESFASSGNREYLVKYNRLHLEVRETLIEQQKNSTYETYNKYTDLINMIKTFDERSTVIVDNYNTDGGGIYIQDKVHKLKRLNGYINDEISQVVSLRLYEVENSYTDLGAEIKQKEDNVYINAIILTITCLALAFIVSSSMSRPIHTLSERLKNVAKGDYITDPIEEKGYGELQVLIEAFNYMIVRISENFNAISERVTLEKRLRKQEVKNLETENLLKASQLDSLQSQINPHFLFNTLNSVGALADIEQAQETKKMISKFSEMLRYNFKKMNSMVSLEDEIKIIENYIYIQKIRFGKRLESMIDVERSTKSIYLPSLVLQPFIENAIIHGIGPKAEGGFIHVIVKASRENIVVLIKDNGVGMSSEKVKSLFPETSIVSENREAIGIQNVIKRLELYYKKNVVEIKSEENKGTQVEIVLPKINKYI